jgi:hypothetical protein
MSNIHIPREHQASPKTTDLDRAVQQAAEEMDRGSWVDDPGNPEAVLDSMGIALGMGNSGVAVGDKPTLDEFQTTSELNRIGRHPRVQEAIEKAQRELSDRCSPDRQVELECMLWEMQASASYKNHWQGQQRWEGSEAEAMRIGQVMSPQAFFDQLTSVIGVTRLIRGTKPDKMNPGDKSGRVGIYIPNPDWKGEQWREYTQAKAKQIRDIGEGHLRDAKTLRRLKQHAKADREFRLAREAGETAGGMLAEMVVQESQNPELLRVATLQWPAMTEWMVMHFDEYGVPTEAKYIGWRTALLTMIRAKVISEAEAHTAFPVGTGEVANWYLEQLYMLRSPNERPN